jgi:ectoine hydroxylase-related dioxygenase (phytanoyl-CoA dioxygenase family)
MSDVAGNRYPVAFRFEVARPTEPDKMAIPHKPRPVRLTLETQMIRQFSDAELNELREFYEEHGAVQLKGLLDPRDAARVLEIADEMAERADEERAAGSDLSFGRASGRMTIRYMWREVPEVRDFLLRAELSKALAKIVGSKQLRFWFDLTFFHNGGSNGDVGDGTAWHHDIAAFAFKGEMLPSLWMALTPATAETSRLMFIDGSHKNVPGFFRPPTTNPDQSDGMLDILDYDALIAEGKEKILTWDCEPGDALIIHPYTIHGAAGNDGSGKRRVAITTRWLGDDVRWLPTNGQGVNMPGLREANLALGSRPKGDYFPLVYDDAAA